MNHSGTALQVSWRQGFFCSGCSGFGVRGHQTGCDGRGAPHLRQVLLISSVEVFSTGSTGSENPFAMPDYRPPFVISDEVVATVGRVSELVGRYSAGPAADMSPKLRRRNRIRTIQASLAIEDNSLTVDQVTALFEGLHVLGRPRDIHEVKNAIAAYDTLPELQPSRMEDLLHTHRLLMSGLTDQAGSWRSGGVGIYKDDQLVFMPPPASQVPRLMGDLLSWLASTDIHPLVASCIFHYELEFIHPFTDGNGRLGRFWQTLILSRWQPALAFLPVETLIRGAAGAVLCGAA